MFDLRPSDRQTVSQDLPCVCPAWLWQLCRDLHAEHDVSTRSVTAFGASSVWRRHGCVFAWRSGVTECGRCNPLALRTFRHRIAGSHGGRFRDCTCLGEKQGLEIPPCRTVPAEGRTLLRKSQPRLYRISFSNCASKLSLTLPPAFSVF